jgi:hypothetical protein
MEKIVIPEYLQHFNLAALTAKIGNKPENIKILLNTFIVDFYKYLNKIRTANLSHNSETIRHNLELISESANSACLDRIYFYTQAILSNDEIYDEEQMNDFIDELENEAEIIRDLDKNFTI